MILVIGGYASGKRKWVSGNLGYGVDEMSDDPASGCPVLYDMHACAGHVRVDDLSAHAVVIMNEVGCGVVPADAAERQMRETAGRMACALAERASCVVRVTCGIGTVIKGALPC